ncbi:hypothetical protein BS78_06G184800 [Paspalum vaginatum]|nr:hypothetical protein BS78_06G184800 [Paspalum vaginatum]
MPPSAPPPLQSADEAAKVQCTAGTSSSRIYTNCRPSTDDDRRQGSFSFQVFSFLHLFSCHSYFLPPFE